MLACHDLLAIDRVLGVLFVNIDVLLRAFGIYFVQGVYMPAMRCQLSIRDGMLVQY